MRLSGYAFALLAIASAISGIALRSKRYDIADSLESRGVEAGSEVLTVALIERSSEVELLSYLEKRRGGGGSGAAGGGGGRGGLLPFALVGSAAALYPGIWLYGAYGYNYHNPYSFRNRTNSTSNANETLPVTCLCDRYSACGCDDNGNRTFLDDLVGNGSYAALNKSVVNVANINGSRTLVLNGTLPNGTDTTDETSAAVRQSIISQPGFWVVSGIVGAMVWLL
ncbi:MAG: hypothetical protein Q9163_003442 [Psora crenata]